MSSSRGTGTPIMDCRSYQDIRVQPVASSSKHPYQSPTYVVPPEVQTHLRTASEHIHASRTVAFPTETVYGLGANSLDPKAVRRVYQIKNRPPDNPLIIHVSSLEMLKSLLPPNYMLSRLYMALISAFWPGPLTLLFPSPSPPPPPAPQTNAIRMPSHPLALALINEANVPISAPSANSSGRPSPTSAQHVYNDLSASEGLGCILDGGDCGVGVESTVVNGLNWVEGGGGTVDILRPGGLGVEEIERIVHEIDGEEGKTEILLHGKPWRSDGDAPSESTSKPIGVDTVKSPPSTPGLKYRHYSPRVPVYLLYPSHTFRRRKSDMGPEITSSQLAEQLQRTVNKHGKARLGLLHYEDSPLLRSLKSTTPDGLKLVCLSLGSNSVSAAQKLFSSMLQLEGRQSSATLVNGHVSEDVTNTADKGVDIMLIEGCTDEGLGLAVMERVGKAVGGGGSVGSVEDGEVADQSKGRYWVDVSGFA